MARVSGPIAASMSFGSAVRSSTPAMSQKIGVAPAWPMVFAAATKLSDGTTTSSPGPQPTASNARWRAAVPFATAKAYFAPQKLANSRSKSATFCPMLHQPDRTTSSAASSISALTSTSDSGTTHGRSPPSLLSPRTGTTARSAPVVAVGPHGLPRLQKCVDQIGKVEVTHRRDVHQSFGLDHVDPHAHGRRHLRLLDVFPHLVPPPIHSEMKDAVVDLDLTVVGCDGDEVAIA